MGLASFAALLNTRLYKLSLIQRRLRVALYAGALDGTLFDTALQAHLAPRAAKYRASIPQQFSSYIRQAQASNSTIGASGRRTNVSDCRFPRRAVPASTIVLSRQGVSWSD